MIYFKEYASGIHIFQEKRKIGAESSYLCQETTSIDTTMAIYYHGSPLLFDTFDLSHALEGDGKAKYGYGAYVTEAYASAAHYAHNKKRPELQDFYVYTMEGPACLQDNWLSLYKRVPVSASILARAEEKLGITFPDEAKAEGIPFRKYLGNWLIGNRSTVHTMTTTKTIDGEKAASAFLLSIGVELIVWPFLWKKPEEVRNLAILDDSQVRILRIDQVDLDPNKNYALIPGSERLVKQF